MYQLTTNGKAVIRLTDGATIPLPANESEGWAYEHWLAAGNTPQPAPVPTLAERIKSAVLKIDQDTDAIIRDVIGERGNEYKLAEEEAKSFKAAGYPATVPASVKSWADAKGWSATQAADDILAVAAGWLNAQSSIRTNRLARKEEARKATTAVGVDTALASWATFVAQMRTSLGV